MSRASLNETESDLHYLAKNYGESTSAREALDLAIGVRKPLYASIGELRRKNDGER